MQKSNIEDPDQTPYFVAMVSDLVGSVCLCPNRKGIGYYG